MSEKMKTVSIKGKAYVQVNERVKAFRSSAEWQGWSIVTDVHELTDDVCVMVAKIIEPSGRVVSTGWAREVRNDAASMVNKTSYVENCETSAVGRAMGFLGIGIDEAICSAQEVAWAIQTQEAQEAQAGTYVQKGNVTYAKQQEPTPTQAEQATEPEIKLTPREQDECDTACADMDNATCRADIVATYNRYKDATFAPKLLAHGNKIIGERGW